MPEIIKRTYETFGNAAKTKALKVLIEAQARLRDETVTQKKRPQRGGTC